MYEDVPNYLNNYDLSEALALLSRHGGDVQLYRVDGNHWHCNAIVDGRKVTGYGAEPHEAANMAWASCYSRVTIGELLWGTSRNRFGKGVKPTTLSEAAANATERAKRAAALAKGPSAFSRLKTRLAVVKERVKARVKRKPKNDGVTPTGFGPGDGPV